LAWFKVRSRHAHMRFAKAANYSQKHLGLRSTLL